MPYARAACIINIDQLLAADLMRLG
jgi:hypothetical protein